LPTLSFVGASLTQPCFVSTSRSSNRTGGFAASGSRRKDHGVAHGKLRVRAVKRTKPSTSCNAVSGYCPSTEAPSLHRHYPISPVLRTSPSPRTARPVSRRFRPAGNWGLRCGAERRKDSHDGCDRARVHRKGTLPCGAAPHRWSGIDTSRSGWDLRSRSHRPLAAGGRKSGFAWHWVRNSATSWVWRCANPRWPHLRV